MAPNKMSESTQFTLETETDFRSPFLEVPIHRNSHDFQNSTTTVLHTSSQIKTANQKNCCIVSLYLVSSHRYSHHYLKVEIDYLL